MMRNSARPRGRARAICLPSGCLWDASQRGRRACLRTGFRVGREGVLALVSSPTSRERAPRWGAIHVEVAIGVASDTVPRMEAARAQLASRRRRWLAVYIDYLLYSAVSAPVFWLLRDVLPLALDVAVPILVFALARYVLTR